MGELHLERSSPYTGKEWTDNNRQRDNRQLKHRAEGEVRTVPCPPELTRLLQAHLASSEPTPRGVCFTVSGGRAGVDHLHPGLGSGSANGLHPGASTSRRWQSGRTTCVTRRSRPGSTVECRPPRSPSGLAIAWLCCWRFTRSASRASTRLPRDESMKRSAGRPLPTPFVDTHWTQMVVVGRCWPVTAGRCSIARSASAQVKRTIHLVRGVPPAGLEPATHGLGNRRSIL